MEPAVTFNKPHISGLDGRQDMSGLNIRLTLADFIARNNVIDIELPVEAEVVSGSVTVRTPFDTTGTDAITVGDSAVANRYMASTSIKSAARTALVPTGFLHGGPNPTAIRITRTAADTDAEVGEITIQLAYLCVGRSDYTCG